MPIKGRIAITGRPGVGKTTLIERVLDRLPVVAGGMITKEIRVCGHRVGFSILDVASGKTGVLAHVHHRDGPKVGRYTVDLESVRDTGIGAIDRAIASAGLVVIDEIGPMELACPEFVPVVERALASDKPLLISTHANADCPIAHRVRQELRLFRVKLGNRDRVIDEIVDHFLASSAARPT
jgi:nucleoside-triphosphatase